MIKYLIKLRTNTKFRRKQPFWFFAVVIVIDDDDAENESIKSR
jgi:hypothetical protein